MANRHRLWTVAPILFIASVSAASPGATILSEEVTLSVLRGGIAHESGSRTIQIDSEAGLPYTTVTLFVPPFAEVSDVTGTARLPDGQDVALERHHIVERPYVSAQAVVTAQKLVDVAFPRAVVGSRIKVFWQRRFNSLLFLPDWQLQRELPIREATLRVSAPQAFDLRYRVLNGALEPTTRMDGGERILTFSVRDVPAYRPEPFAPPAWLTAGMVELLAPSSSYGGKRYELTRWRDIAGFYDDLAGGRYLLEGPLARELHRERRKIGDQRQRLQLVYERLQRFRYLQTYLATGGYQPHASMWTLRRGYGDCKDLTTLFIAMARESGLSAHPVLTRIPPARPFDPDLPAVSHFNHVITRITTDDGPLYVDATAPTYRLGTLPSVLSGAPALLIRHGKHELLTLPPGGAGGHRLSTVLHLEGGSGPLSGTVESIMSGDRQAAGRALAQAGKRRLEGREAQYVLSGARSAVVEQLELLDADDHLTARGTYRSSARPIRHGGGLIISPSLLLSDARVRAFAASERRLPIDLGQAGDSELIMHWPVDGATARCPEPTAADSRFGSYSLDCKTGPTTLTITRRLAVRQPQIQPAEYQEARAFWQTVVRGDHSGAVVSGGGG